MQFRFTGQRAASVAALRRTANRTVMPFEVRLDDGVLAYVEDAANIDELVDSQRDVCVVTVAVVVEVLVKK